LTLGQLMGGFCPRSAEATVASREAITYSLPLRCLILLLILKSGLKSNSVLELSEDSLALMILELDLALQAFTLKTKPSDS
jgi:hypothetical protein